MRNLTGKIAWITGAGTGIGAAAAIALAAEGMRVVLSGRRASALATVAAGIGENAEVMPLDVADADAVKAAADAILARHGRIDVLVASAGVNVKSRNWHSLSTADWDSVVRIDLDGAFYCAHAVLPAMKRQGEGLIVNISSWAGKYVSAVTGPAYTAAKHALNAMTESINLENGIHGVRACAICPGEVSTPILEQRPVPVSAEERARMVQPEDCGAIVAFVAKLPAHVCINELTVSPAWNRFYVAQARSVQPPAG